MDSDPNGTFPDFSGGVQVFDGEDLRAAVPALLLAVCVSGAAGNLLVLLALARDFRAGRGSEAKALLASAAAADALLLVLCAPARALAAYKQAWVLGRFTCATADWFQHACLVAKTLVLALSARAEHTPEPAAGGGPRRGWVPWAVALAWLASMLLAAPQMLFTGLQTLGAPRRPLCVSQPPACAAPFLAAFYKAYPAVAYAGPVLFAVGAHTRSLHRALNGAPCSPRRQSKVTLVLLCLSGALGLLLLPEWGAFTWVRLGYRRPPAGLLLGAQMLVYLCGALSPLLLLAMYEDVRRGLAALCRRRAGAKAGPCRSVDGNGAEVLRSDAEMKSFPDVEHFWTGRRNTQVEEEQDPVPWEKDDKML